MTPPAGDEAPGGRITIGRSGLRRCGRGRRGRRLAHRRSGRRLWRRRWRGNRQLRGRRRLGAGRRGWRGRRRGHLRCRLIARRDLGRGLGGGPMGADRSRSRRNAGVPDHWCGPGRSRKRRRNGCRLGGCGRRGRLVGGLLSRRCGLRGLLTGDCRVDLARPRGRRSRFVWLCGQVEHTANQQGCARDAGQ